MAFKHFLSSIQAGIYSVILLSFLLQASLNIIKRGEERLPWMPTQKTFNCDKRLALLPLRSHSLFSSEGFFEKVKAARHLRLFLDVPVHGTGWRRTWVLHPAIKAWLWKSLRELPSVQLFRFVLVTLKKRFQFVCINIQISPISSELSPFTVEVGNEGTSGRF